MKEGGFFSEFKTFISRGNVVDMAVGVVIGGAFTAIINSLVKDLFMPLIGMITGGINFAELNVTIPAKVEGAEPVVLAYGSFIQAIINFLLVGFCMFIVVKNMNRMKKKEEEAAPEPEAPAEPEIPEDIKLLTEIRDLLSK
jgi:large conductance mechanosensitive channel